MKLLEKLKKKFTKNKFNYKSYWVKDKTANVIPLTGEENPEGFDPKDILKEITKDLEFDSVIDFGCGYGRLSQAFDKNKYVGVDLSSYSLAKATKNNPGYKYKEVNVEMPKYPEADLGMAYTVFLHLDDDTLDGILSSLLKTTKKYFIIAEICGREWRRDGLPPVFNRETEEYQEFMKKYGFELKSEVSHSYKRYAVLEKYKDHNTDIQFMLFERV